jgi:NAD+ kinase
MSSRRGAVGFILHPRESEHDRPVAAGVARAEAHGFATWVAREDAAGIFARHAASTELLVTVGGDGTFLLGARLAAAHGIPVLGANRGQLGFLTDIEVNDLPTAIDEIVAGRQHLYRRSLLELEVPRAEGLPPACELALNEVVVKSMGSNLARLRVEVDAELLGEFDADGVVVATATGSTAYALSAGGPPVDPRVRAIVVVPLAAHAVMTRAVILPEAVTVATTLVHGRAFVAADGGTETPLWEGARVVARPGPKLEVVQLAGSPSFLRRLREKVRFGLPLKPAVDEQDWHRPAVGEE